MIKRICVLALLVVVMAACGSGSNPSAPSQVNVNVAGTWSGSTVSPQYGTYTLTVSVAQSGNSLNGNWTSGGGDGGNMSGTVGGGGVIQMNLQQSNRTFCPYNATVTVNGSSMSGTYAAYDCTGPISGTVSLTKR